MKDEKASPFRFNGKSLTLSFYEAPEKNRASKDFPLHSHNFSDIINFSWGYSPIRMTFYSTKFPCPSDNQRFNNFS